MTPPHVPPAITESRTVEVTFETLAKVAAWACAALVGIGIVIWRISAAATVMTTDIVTLKADVAEIKCTVKPNSRGCWVPQTPLVQDWPHVSAGSAGQLIARQP